MKYIFCLMLGLMLSGQGLLAQDNTEKTIIHLDGRTWKIDRLLEEVERQIGFSFSYGAIDTAKQIILSDRSLILDELLIQALQGQSIDFMIEGKRILLVPRQEEKKKINLNGYILDKASGEALIGVTVLDTIGHQGTTTNPYGYFSYTTEDWKDIPLLISYVGYRDTLVWITPHSKGTVNIFLNESSEELGEVLVVGNRRQDSQMSINTISPKDLGRLPSFMGEPDLLKSITLMPGIKFGSDNTSGFYVRGGGPDQNLILLDGATVYNAAHAFNLFSTFNAGAVKQVDVIKGGFPARYSGRLSSVLDVRLREGNTQKLTGEVGVGYLLSKFTVEGPIFSENTSFLISGRRTFLDLIFKAVGDFDPDPNSEIRQDVIFQDLTGKINHRFSEKDHVFLSYYGSGDKFKVLDGQTYLTEDSEFSTEVNVNLGWSNRIVSGRWNHLFSDRLFMNTSATYTKFEIDTEVETSERSVIENETGFAQNLNSFSSAIEDYGLKVQFDYFPSPAHDIKFGIQSILHQFRPGISAFRIGGGSSNYQVDTLFDDQKTRSIETSVFVEDEIALTSRLNANVGMHGVMLQVEDQKYWSAQPRLAFNYKWTNKISSSVSYAEMAQFVHLLTNSTLGIPLDLWVPSTPDAPPMKSRQIAAGLNYNPSSIYQLTFETYYKKMDQLIAYKEGARFTDAQERWQSKIVKDGEGEAYGFEVFLQKKEGKFTGWLGYTLSWTNRTFELLNEGNPYPYKYDRRHDISLVMMHEINERINLSSSWVFATGNAVSFPNGSFQGLSPLPNVQNPAPVTGFPVEVYDGRNSVRMPNYHRLDLGINLIKHKKRGVRTWNFSIYNTYIRQNPFLVFVNDPEPGSEIDARNISQISSFWIVPSFTYTYKFN